MTEMPKRCLETYSFVQTDCVFERGAALVEVHMKVSGSKYIFQLAHTFNQSTRSFSSIRFHFLDERVRTMVLDLDTQ